MLSFKYKFWDFCNFTRKTVATTICQLHIFQSINISGIANKNIQATSITHQLQMQAEESLLVLRPNRRLFCPESSLVFQLDRGDLRFLLCSRDQGPRVSRGPGDDRFSVIRAPAPYIASYEGFLLPCWRRRQRQDKPKQNVAQLVVYITINDVSCLGFGA